MANEFLKLTQTDPNADAKFFTDLGGQADGKSSWPEAQAKQQAAMVAIMKGGNVEDNYQRVYSNLTQTGSDPDIDSLRADKKRDMEDIDRAVAEHIVAATGVSPQEKIGLVTELVQSQKDKPTPQLREVYAEEQAINADTTTGAEERSHQSIMNNIEAIKAADTEIERLVQSRAAKFDPNLGKAFVDFTATALLPGFGIKLKQIIDDVLPEEGSVFHNLAPGEALKEYRRVMAEATPEKRVEIAKRLLKAGEEMAGLAWENNFEEYTFLMDLFSDLHPSDAEVQQERWLNNFFGVLDLLPFGASAVKGSKFVLKTVKRASPIGTAAETAPRNASEIIKAALDDSSDAMVDAAGTSREELVNTYSMPKAAADGVEVQVGPDINAILARPKGRPQGLDTNSINYTPQEKALAKDRTEEIIQEISSLVPVEHLSKTVIEQIPGGISAKTVVGPTDSYGWSTAEDAIEASKDFIEVTEGASVTILRRDYEAGKFVPAEGKALQGEGEFLAQITVDHLYNSADVLGKSFDEPVIGVTGSTAKWVNKSSVFPQWINLAGNVAAEGRSGLKADLIRTMEPFNKLSAKGQSRIMAALDEGDQWVNPATGVQEGKWFSHDELVDKFEGNQKLIDGYQSVRKHQERVYELQNERLRDTMVSRGMQRVVNEETGFDGVAKRMDRGDLEQGRLTMYDAQREGTTSLAPEELDDLYAQGGYVARTPHGMRYGDEVTDLIVVKPGDKTRLQKLPEYVLKQRAGYITKIYDTTHLVKKKITGVRRNGQLIPGRGTLNGKSLKDGEMLVTVKMANNPVAAERAARLLQKEAKEGEEYGVIRAQELSDQEYAHQSSYEFYQDRGQLFFSKRGAEVETVTGERSLKSIADSIEIARNNAARHAAMDNLLDSMTKRWEKKYGALFWEGQEGRFPVRELPPKPRDPKLMRDWEDSIALRDHINMLAGIDLTTTRRNFTRMNIWMAEKLAGMGEGRLLGLNEKLSETILRNRDKNILDVAKSLAFIKFIVTSPARQLLLQAQQASVMLGMDYGFRYFASGKGIRDWAGLTAGLAAIDRPNVWRVLAPQAAKGMGMSTKEYTELVQAFRKSGIPNSIDSHAFVQIMAVDPRSRVADSVLGKTAAHLQGGMDSALRLARKVGFDAGEYTNLSAAWLAVRNKWIKNNPGKNWLDPDNLAEITGQTRAVTFNMNAAGTLHQQKGLAGLMFQFMSHTTKAIQVLIPDTRLTRKLGIGKLADRSFSNREKLRIALTQAAIYGTAGLGLNAAYEKFRDEAGIVVPPKASQVIEEGLAGWGISAIFGAIGDADGEDTSLAFSETFAPFSGNPQATPLNKIIPFIADAAMLQSPDFRMLVPASFSAIHQIGNTIDTVNFILNGVDLPETAPNKYLAAAERALAVTQGYDTFLQARVASQIGQFTTRNGNPTVQAAGGEILARATFGIRTRSEAQVSGMLRDIKGTLTQTEEGINKKIDEYARQYAIKVMSVFRQLEVQGDNIPAQAFEALEPHITAMKLGLNEAEFFRFKQALQRRLFQDLGKNNETRLSEEITRLIHNGEEIGGPITTKIRNMEPFQGQEELINWFNALEGQSTVGTEK